MTPRGGGFALSVRRRVLAMAEAMARSGVATRLNPAWLFVDVFYRVFLRISHGASRLQEVLADRWATSAYGSEQFVSGLERTIASAIRFEAHVNQTLREVVDANLALANLYTYTPAEPLDEEEVAGAIDEAMDRSASAYDSHPAPADRIAWARRMAIVCAENDDTRSAWSLLSDRRQLERGMTELVRTRVTERTGIVIPARGKKRKKKRRKKARSIFDAVPEARAPDTDEDN